MSSRITAIHWHLSDFLLCAYPKIYCHMAIDFRTTNCQSYYRLASEGKEKHEIQSLSLEIDFIFQISFIMFWTIRTASGLKMKYRPIYEWYLAQSISNIYCCLCRSLTAPTFLASHNYSRWTSFLLKVIDYKLYWTCGNSIALHS